MERLIETFLWDTVKEGGKGGFQAEVRTWALYLSEES